MTTTLSRIGICLLVPAMFSLSAAQAAEPIPWTELAEKIGHGKIARDGHEERQYRVIMKDRQSYVGNEMILTTTGVSVSIAGPVIPREQVKEIRIRRNVSIGDSFSAAPASFLFAKEDENFIVELILLWPVLIPAAGAVMAAASPISLPLHAIKQLRSHKRFEVAP